MCKLLKSSLKALLMLSAVTAFPVFAQTVVDDGNGPDDQWRIPESNLTAEKNATVNSIEQTIFAWAQAMDSQDPEAVASLFTTDGKWGLYSTNTAVTPWVQVPTGYSPSQLPTGGAAGGGCTAVGRDAIANYVRGTGRVAAYSWPDLAKYRTLILDTMVKLDATDKNSAMSHSYVVEGAWKGGAGTQQMFARFKYVGGQGWRFSELRQLFTAGQPNLPCQN